MINKYKIALIHDYLIKTGGAERTLEEISNIWKTAPIYTLLYNKEKLKLNMKNIRPSYLNKFPKIIKNNHKFLLPFLMIAPETFDLRHYDVVISSSGAFSKGIVTKPKTLHISYCHSPMRFAWDYTHNYLNEATKSDSLKFLTRGLLNYIRIWDYASSDRVDYYLANSKATQAKLLKYYRKESTVIYPPVHLEKFNHKSSENKGDYYLVISRLSKYKKVDITVEAFNKLGFKLKVIGEGEEFNNLKKKAMDNVEILGYQNEKNLIQYVKNCKALVMPSDEDFGISAVEAMAAGKPVLAYNAGGGKETVKPGFSGEFFDAQTIEVLAEGVYRIESNIKKYKPRDIIESVKKFGVGRFKKELQNFVENKLNQNDR